MLQELKLPALQRLEVPAKTALALLKYLPLPAPLAADVAASLQVSTTDPVVTALIMTNSLCLLSTQGASVQGVTLIPKNIHLLPSDADLHVQGESRTNKQLALCCRVGAAQTCGQRVLRRWCLRSTSGSDMCSCCPPTPAQPCRWVNTASAGLTLTAAHVRSSLRC